MLPSELAGSSVPEVTKVSAGRLEVPSQRRDCNLNGVTPETEETPVTDVTTSQGQESVELSAADEQLMGLASLCGTS